MERRDFLKLMPLGAAQALGPAAPAGKPNILILMSDQHRAGLAKRSGYALDTSPAADRLAAQGVSFDHAYATQPICSPSRTSLITGRWPHAHRVRQNSGLLQAFFTRDLFDVVKAQGYKTGLTGKNHTYVKPEKLDFWREYNDIRGWQPESAPQEIVEFDKWRQHLNFGCPAEPTPFPLETQFCYRAVSSAIEFIDQCGDQPFALEVSFPEPHEPQQIPKPYFDMFPPDAVPPRATGPEALRNKGFLWRWMRGLQEHYHPDYDGRWRRYVSNYLGSLRMIDDQFARLMAHLEQKHLRERTIIVYLADHGDYLMDYGLMRKGVGLPEAIARIPMIWSGPGIQRGRGSHPAFVSNADVLPTICDALRAEMPPGMQGRSLWPLLQGQDYPQEEFRSVYAEAGYGGLYYDSADQPPYTLGEFRGFSRLGPVEQETFDELNSVTQSGYMKMVRMGKWKLVYDMMGYGELYDLEADPNELKNLFNDPAVAAEQMRLAEELLMWTIRTQDTLPVGLYKTKWPGAHNWYTPHRHGTAPEAFIP